MAYSRSVFSSMPSVDVGMAGKSLVASLGAAAWRGWLGVKIWLISPVTGEFKSMRSEKSLGVSSFRLRLRKGKRLPEPASLIMTSWTMRRNARYDLWPFANTGVCGPENVQLFMVM